MDRVSQTFVGKKVLVSGGTGFLGKVFIEKLLRVCPDVQEIILIIRSKKGKDPKQRIADILKNALFQTLLSQMPLEDVLSKITTVSGDIKEPHLGLSVTDREICQQAHIIVHSAATVRFNESIKSAVMQNCGGTRSMLELAKQCPNLQLMIHVSTAYCQVNEIVLEEQFYPPPMDPASLFTLLESIDDDTIKILTPKLLGNYPNTYVYSKSISEKLVEECKDTLPVVVVRPSIVIPLAKEPLVGWTDNINGPMGLLIGAGKGVLKTMYGDESQYVDLIPADYVINGMIAVAWDYIENGYKHELLNLVASDERQISWKELIDIGKGVIYDKVCFDNMLWLPSGTFTTKRWLHNVRFMLYQYIPAMLVDSVLFILGYKPFLMRVQKRILSQYDLLEYYTCNSWFFKNDKVRSLRAKLNVVEKETYVIDAKDFNIQKYVEESTLAARRLLLNEKDENLPRARRNLKILKIADAALKGIFYLLIFYFVLVTIYSFL